jgi:GNAT superfamily N-acetyltransferase
MTPAQALREQRRLMPRSPDLGDVPPERACAVMADELEALGADIAAARRSARATSISVFGASRPARPPDGERVRLARGRQIAIRPVRPDDAGRLRAAFARMGALTRYRRFLRVQDRLSSNQIAYLTHVDHVDHEALVALDVCTGEIVGVARYVREAADRRQARVAAVVVDAWQRHGVGTALIARLAGRAHANGVTTLTGATAAGNHAARRLFRSPATVADERPGTLQLTVRLDQPPAEPPPELREPGRPSTRPVLVYAAER